MASTKSKQSNERGDYSADGEHEVDHIIREQIRRDTQGIQCTHYLIRWMTYPDEVDSWIPDYNLGVDLITNWNATKVAGNKPDEPDEPDEPAPWGSMTFAVPRPSSSQQTLIAPARLDVQYITSKPPPTDNVFVVGEDPRTMWDIQDQPRRLGEQHDDWAARVKDTRQRLGIDSKPYPPGDSDLTIPEGTNVKKIKDLRHQARNGKESEHLNKLRAADPSGYSATWRTQKRARQEHNRAVDDELIRQLRKYQADNGFPREPTPDPAEDSGDGFYNMEFERPIKGSLKKCLNCSRRKKKCDLIDGSSPPCSFCIENNLMCTPLITRLRVRGIPLEPGEEHVVAVTHPRKKASTGQTSAASQGRGSSRQITVASLSGTRSSSRAQIPDGSSELFKETSGKRTTILNDDDNGDEDNAPPPPVNVSMRCERCQKDKKGCSLRTIPGTSPPCDRCVQKGSNCVPLQRSAPKRKGGRGLEATSSKRPGAESFRGSGATPTPSMPTPRPRRTPAVPLNPVPEATSRSTRVQRRQRPIDDDGDDEMDVDYMDDDDNRVDVRRQQDRLHQMAMRERSASPNRYLWVQDPSQPAGDRIQVVNPLSRISVEPPSQPVPQVSNFRETETNEDRFHRPRGSSWDPSNRDIFAPALANANYIEFQNVEPHPLHGRRASYNEQQRQLLLAGDQDAFYRDTTLMNAYNTATVAGSNIEEQFFDNTLAAILAARPEQPEVIGSSGPTDGQVNGYVNRVVAGPSFVTAPQGPYPGDYEIDIDDSPGMVGILSFPQQTTRQGINNGLDGNREIGLRSEQQAENTAGSLGLGNESLQRIEHQSLVNPFQAGVPSQEPFSPNYLGAENPHELLPNPYPQQLPHAPHQTIVNSPEVRNFFQIDFNRPLRNSNTELYVSTDILNTYPIYLPSAEPGFGDPLDQSCREDPIYFTRYWNGEPIHNALQDPIDLTEACSKPGRNCQHTHHPFWATCPDCRALQNTDAIHWRNTVEPGTKAFFCSSCADELRGRNNPLLPASPNVQMQIFKDDCLCLGTLKKTWLCHAHRLEGYNKIAVETSFADEWMARLGMDRPFCLGCYSNDQDPSTQIYVCKACKTLVDYLEPDVPIFTI